MSLALYRKYRPATFAEVRGQDHATGPLIQALASDRVHHAYLFSGPRGCGKTSSARILARSLNCATGVTPTPCGVCDSCVALAPNGPGRLDVIEIDAASHGGVDDARDLRDGAHYAPVADRFKVYIIDEAHMVTPQGFNALLKLVEEPPSFVKFIFATTEPDKVLTTIRSRTHHYAFRLVPPTVLRELLAEICEREQVTVDPLVLPLVVRAGAGSVRDSLSVLDQLLSGVGTEGLTYHHALAQLGVTAPVLLDEVVDALAAGDAATIFQTIERLVEAGHDVRRFATDLLDRLRDLVLLDAVPTAGESGLVTAPPEEIARMQGQAVAMGTAGLARAASLLADGLTDMRGATAPRLVLELVVARILLASGDRSVEGTAARLEQLERRLMLGAPATGPTPTAGRPAAGQPVAQPQAPVSQPQARPAPAPVAQPPAPVAPQAQAPVQQPQAPAAQPQPPFAPEPQAPAPQPPVAQPQALVVPEPQAPVAQPQALVVPEPQARPQGEARRPSSPAAAETRHRQATTSSAPTGHAGPAGAAANLPVGVTTPAPAGPTTVGDDDWPETVLPGTARPAEPSSSRPAGEAPTGTERREVDQRDSNRPNSNPPGSDPTSSDPTSSDPTSSDPTSSSPPGSAPPNSAPSGSDPPNSNPADSDRTDEQPAAEPPASEPPASDARPEVSSADGLERTAPADGADQPGVVDVAGLRRVWPDVLERVKGIKRTPHAMLSDAQVVAVEGTAVHLGFPHAALSRRFAEPAHVTVLVQALTETLGGRWSVVCTVLGQPVPEPDPVVAPAAPAQPVGFAEGDEPADDGPDDSDEAGPVTRQQPEDVAVALLREGLGARPLDDRPR